MRIPDSVRCGRLASLLAASVVLLSSVSLAFEHAPVSGVETSTAYDESRPVYDMTPPTGTPGTDVSVVILSHDANRKEIVTKDTQLVPPNGISVTNVAMTSNASLTATL